MYASILESAQCSKKIGDEPINVVFFLERKE
jgi:hypothetical protein